jgi:hypothetical protein
MNKATLKYFRIMSEALGKRDREEITIELKSGSVLNATYDPLFKSVIIAGTSFPADELSRWTKMFWGSEAVKVVKRFKSPVSAKAEN